MAQGLEAVAHPFILIHLVREYVVYVARWSDLPETLTSSADRMLR